MAALFLCQQGSGIGAERFREGIGRALGVRGLTTT